MRIAHRFNGREPPSFRDAVPEGHSPWWPGMRRTSLRDDQIMLCSPTDTSVGYWRIVPAGTRIEQPWSSRRAGCSSSLTLGSEEQQHTKGFI
ncbi:MAG: hypothetical protein GY801_05565 [bacterium]|nr:hypothetical protein [bacterium]